MSIYASREKFLIFLKLIRVHNLTGFFLAFFPACTSVFLACDDLLSTLGYFFLVLVGAFLSRSVGCIVNDLWDIDIDKNVARTSNRPLATGDMSVNEALYYLWHLIILLLICLLFTNMLTVAVAMLTAALVVIYPATKRFFAWPQIFLGFTFNLGAIIGWVAVRGSFALQPFLVYLGCVFWTVGYDTIYALQDKDDDLKLGLNSTAIAFQEPRDRVMDFYLTAWSCWLCAGIMSSIGVLFYCGMVLVGFLLFLQYWKMDLQRPDLCMQLFKSNEIVGLVLIVSVFSGANL